MHSLSRIACESVTLPTAASAGKTLFLAGEPCERWFTLRAGIACASETTTDGGREIVALFFPGDRFGLPVARMHRYSAEAVTDLVYLGQSPEVWLSNTARMICQNGSLPPDIGREAGAFRRRSRIVRHPSVTARLAEFILLLLERWPGEGLERTLPLAQIDVAAYLALTPESVCRGLRAMRELRVIAMPRRDRLIVRDYASLVASTCAV